MTDEIKEKYLGKPINCLDKGFVRLVDIMGDDSAIVQAARVSYGAGTKSVNEDEGLIRYLIRHRHTSPFEMVEYKFHIKLPIFIARQWIRHRTANVNEYSGRYSEMKDEFYIPDIDQIRTQSSLNKQGRSEERLNSESAATIASMLNVSQRHLYEEYLYYLEQNTAREIARINLPLSTYTEWYWKIDLHNLFHFLELRLDSHAQYEIRIYADKIAEIVKACNPLAWQAYEDYVLNGITFSRQELNLLKDVTKDFAFEPEVLKTYGLSGLEAREFKIKLEKMYE